MFSSPFNVSNQQKQTAMQQQQQQQQQAMNTNNNNNNNNATNNDAVSSYKERFQNSINKFSSPTPHRKNSTTSESNGSSHLGFLFDKAQGLTPQSSISPEIHTSPSNGYHDSVGVCSKYLIDPQSAIRKPQGVDDEASITGRAVPATPDFLRSSSYSPMSVNESQMSPRPQQPWAQSKLPERDHHHPHHQPPRPNSSRSTSRSSMDEGRVRTPQSMSEEHHPRRPSFEQTRRHWVYTPKMFNNQNSDEDKPVERKVHPGARSRPLPDYLNFRKYSVPLISPRPKVEVKQKAVDDQTTGKEMKPLNQSDIDSSSVHHLLREGDELSFFNEDAIRYTGGANPSKVFQLLQSATGSQENILEAKPPVRRRSKKPEPEEPAQDADDIVDITYVGGNIPSRTFQNLRDAFDDKDSRDPFSSTECLLEQPSEPIRSVKVIHLRPRKSIDDGITSF